MKWFGPPWDAPVCEESERIAAPAAGCAACLRPFLANDCGVMADLGDGALPYHHRCLVRLLGLAPEVHVLFAGSALCALKGIPVDWPAKHTWVRAEEADPLATCPGCIDMLAEARQAKAIP